MKKIKKGDLLVLPLKSQSAIAIGKVTSDYQFREDLTESVHHVRSVEWIDALNRRFPHWRVHISDRLTDTEFGAGKALEALQSREHVYYDPRLHLSVSMRSFRAEHVSQLVKQLLDLDQTGAKETLLRLAGRYPIVLTRDLNKAKAWLRSKARGSERYGIVASSAASRDRCRCGALRRTGQALSRYARVGQASGSPQRRRSHSRP